MSSPHGLRVLIADDEDIIRVELAEYLGELPEVSAVYTAADGNAAVGILQEHPVDAVISDIRMPNLDGIGLLKKVREISPHTKVILVTGFQSITTAVDATRNGAYDYIGKPFNMLEIRQLLKKINEVRMLNDQLKEKERQLMRAKFIGSLGAVAAGIMHEINNPNTFINGNATILRNRLKKLAGDPAAAKPVEDAMGIPVTELAEMVGGILTGSERIAAIIERAATWTSAVPDLRPTWMPAAQTGAATWTSAVPDFRMKGTSSTQTGTSHHGTPGNGIAEVVDLREIVALTLERVRPDISAASGVTLRNIPAGAASPVRADREAMYQVVSILVTNAVEAASRGGGGHGTVVVRTEFTEDRGAKLVVEDNGSGIIAKDPERIFEPFETTKKDRPGRGLGLFIAHQIISGLNGTIRHERIDGALTRFTVNLPVHATTQPQEVRT